MNEDILKGKWLEIQGRVKEKWGKLNNNDFIEIEGRGEKLLGLLQKRYGYIREKAELEYQDSVEVAAIVGSIREIMTKNEDFIPFAYIARYWQPLLAKKQESQIAGTAKKNSHDPDPYFDSRICRTLPAWPQGRSCG